MASRAYLDWNPESLLTQLTALVSERYSQSRTCEIVSRIFEHFACQMAAQRAGLFLTRHAAASIHVDPVCSLGFTPQQLELLQAGKRPAQTALLHLWNAIDRKSVV